MTDYKTITGSAPVVMVEFYATWCPHCQRMMPVVAEIRELLGSAVPVYQFDIDKNEEQADRAGVSGIPTFIIYRNGSEVWKYSGEIDGNVLLQKIQSYMN